MSEATASPKRFVLFVLLLLPSFFFAWYGTAHLLAKGTAWPLNISLPQMLPGYVYQMVPAEKHLVMLSLIKPNKSQEDRPVNSGQAVEINLLARSFCIPLFLALAVASEAGLLAHALRIAVGLLITYLYTLFSIVMRVLYVLLFDIRFMHMEPISDSRLVQEAVLNGYYLSSVIFPALLPIILWAMLYPETFKSIVPVDRLNRRFAKKSSNSS